MEFAIQTRGSWDVIQDTARWAEERGLSAIALPDHYLERGNDPQRPAYDHLIHLAALAPEARSFQGAHDQLGDFDPHPIFLSSAGPGLAARKDADYRRLLGLYAERTNTSPTRIEAVYETRGYPHGPGDKAAEMLAALSEAGCQRFYMQMFLGDTQDLDVVLDAYRG
ncbi:MAG TPA: hypothetical protein VI980_00465 [Acidimicrobiia bacterium]|nr:hypothetical protein [Acidimicrobiia bacterium]